MKHVNSNVNSKFLIRLMNLFNINGNANVALIFYQKNMDKHLKSKKHLKFASDFGPGSGGSREGAGRKPKETVTFDR